MLARSIKRLAASAALVMAVCGAGTAAAADTIDLFYNVPLIGVSLDYGGMGYTDADGNFVNLAGQEILSASVEIDFRPGRSIDWNTLHMAMVVPVEGAESQYFAVDASQLVETSPGLYHFEMTTDDFNGVIYSGRWSIESYALDADGNPIKIGGWLSPDTGFSFTVSSPSAVPEPASAAMLLAGLALIPVFARRKSA